MIVTTLRESRDFFDADWTYDEMQGIYQEYRRYYLGLIDQLSAGFGHPCFSGDSGSKGAPAFAYSNADETTCWDTAEGCLQLELGHEDKELPIVLYAVCHPTERVGGSA